MFCGVPDSQPHTDEWQPQDWRRNYLEPSQHPCFDPRKVTGPPCSSLLRVSRPCQECRLRLVSRLGMLRLATVFPVRSQGRSEYLLHGQAAVASPSAAFSCADVPGTFTVVVLLVLRCLAAGSC